jgi:hypothetical protein
MEENGGEWPQDIRDDRGRPILSWRVRILRELGYADLYSRFDPKEPWNSSKNPLAGIPMPDVFVCPTTALNSPGERTTTNYFLVKDKSGAVFVKELGDIFVYWTQPTQLDSTDVETIERIVAPTHPGYFNNCVQVTSESTGALNQQDTTTKEADKTAPQTNSPSPARVSPPSPASPSK